MHVMMKLSISWTRREDCFTREGLQRGVMSVGTETSDAMIHL